ncbi:cyclase family protein [Corynebacterium glyciniphilum]|uniref:cyclase family protein n=1 Tax=Corynebacterium glyciniphilum TaxID=1404244 RepID=UPI003FD128D6
MPRTCFDLTHPIATDMPVYPGDPTVTVTEVATVVADGCSVRSLSLGTHTGTHVDAPAHVDQGGRTVDGILPGELTGTASVLHIPALRPGEIITPAHLGAWRPARIVLIATGWDAHWGTDAYSTYPVLGEEACRLLTDAGMHLLGLDTASPDPPGADVLSVHDLLLGADHLIIENLRGLADLPSSVEFTALPLPVVGGDGSPVRAVARRRTACQEGRRGNPSGWSD